VLDYDAPPYIPLTTADWNSPIKYRCDNNLAGIAGPGCVFYEFTPTRIRVSRGYRGEMEAMIGALNSGAAQAGGPYQAYLPR
jgi:hypothetical protein